MVTDPAQTKKDVLTEFRRASILEAAFRAFARHGYQSTTVDTIAAEADIAKGTIYLYFKSKADIYHAAVKHGLSGLYAETERALTSDAPCREKLDQFIRLRFDYMAHNHEFYRIYLSEFGDASSRPPEAEAELQKMKLRQVELVESMLTQAIAHGEIRPMAVATTARAISDVVRGLIQNRLLNCVDPDQTADIQSVVDLLWNGLRPTP
jgi:AcrR family transcriptional regulator